MNLLHEGSGALLAGMWNTSWQVALLVVAVLLAQRLCGRWLSPRWRYALWLLVVARLFVPVVPQVPLGLVAWEASGSGATPVVSVVATPTPGPGILPPRPTPTNSRPVASPRPGEETGSAAPLLAAADPSPAAGPPREGRRNSSPRNGRRPRGADRDGTGSGPAAVERAAPARAPAFPWRTAVAGLWLAGVALLALRLLARELRFRRRLTLAIPVGEPRLRALLAECARQVGVRRPVRVVSTDLVTSPAVCGVRRPVLLLPPQVHQDFTEAELRCVLLHELHHLRGPDVLLNGVLAGLGCLYWFHPLVRVAIARVRHSQEALRDWEALSTERAPAPALYAETVLKLLERKTEAREPALAVGFQTGGNETRKRILMIANFDKSSRGAWSLGAGLFLVLGWVSFTSAAPKAPLALEQSPPTAVAGLEIEVERHQPPPAWWAELDAALEKPIAVSVEDADLGTLVDFLRESTGVNFVVQRSLFEDYDSDEFTYQLPERTVRNFLDLMCRMISEDVTYCYARGAVCIGYSHDLPWRQDLRFYRIAPLLEEGGEPEDLFELVMMFSGEDEGVWEREGTSLTYWNELFAVKQTDEVHGRVHRFLNDLLRRSTKKDVDGDDGGDWAAQAERMLAETRLSVDFEDLELGEAVDYLSQALGIPVIIEDEDLTSEPVLLTLQDARAADVLGWMAAEHGLNVLPREGRISLTQDVELVLEIYQLTELDELVGDTEDLRNTLDSMMRDDIAPWVWESQPGASIAYWQDLMLVTATPGMHVEIGQLIGAVTRAMR